MPEDGRRRCGTRPRPSSLAPWRSRARRRRARCTSTRRSGSRSCPTGALGSCRTPPDQPRDLGGRRGPERRASTHRRPTLARAGRSHRGRAARRHRLRPARPAGVRRGRRRARCRDRLPDPRRRALQRALRGATTARPSSPAPTPSCGRRPSPTPTGRTSSCASAARRRRGRSSSGSPPAARSRSSSTTAAGPSPVGLPVTMVGAEPVALASALAAAVVRQAGSDSGPGSLAGLLASRGRCRRDGDARLAGRASRSPSRGRSSTSSASTLPDGAILLAGNSMPVRDMEAFLGSGAQRPALPGQPRRQRHRRPRLDGPRHGRRRGRPGRGRRRRHLPSSTTSTPSSRRGDSASRPRSSLVNNDGGGIFSFLPQASAARPEVGLPEHFEELFGTPHGLDLGPLVRALGSRARVAGAARPRGGRAGVHRPAGRPGPRGAHGAGPQRRAAPRAAWPPWHGPSRCSAPAERPDDTDRPAGRGARGHGHGRRAAGAARSTASRARRPAGPRSWTACRGRHRVVVPDLLGHGRSDAPHDPAPLRPVPPGRRPRGRSSSSSTAEPATVVGYSMGARLALMPGRSSIPRLVRALVLESPSAGFADAGRASSPTRRRRALGEAARGGGPRRLRRRLGGAAALRQPGRAAAGESRERRRAERLAPRPARPWPPRCGAPARAPWSRSTTGSRASASRPSSWPAAATPWASSGRATWRALPGAAARVVADAGHAPHLERPGAVSTCSPTFLGAPRALTAS